MNARVVRSVQRVTALTVALFVSAFATTALAETAVRVGPLVLESTAPEAISYVDETDFVLVLSSEPGAAEAPLTAVDVSLGPDNTSTSGCETDDFAGFPSGHIALVQRGACAFSTKANNAAAAGASAVLIFNQGSNSTNLGLITASMGTTYVGGVPVFFLTYSLGERLATTSGSVVRVDAPVFRGTRQEAYFRYCLANRDKCALSVKFLDDGRERHLNPDRLQVTASTYKTLMLIGYAEAVVAGTLDPTTVVDRDDWARFSVRRDGGALTAAWQRLGEPLTVTLDQMMSVMMRESDNAAPDFLLSLLGRATFADIVERVMPGFHDVPDSINAIFINNDGHPMEADPATRVLSSYTDYQDAAYRTEVAALFDLMENEDYAQQVRDYTCVSVPWASPPADCASGFVTSSAQYKELLGRFFTRSNTRSYMRLMEGLLDGSLLPQPVYDIMAPHLEYRLNLPGVTGFTRYGGKGGSFSPQDVCNWTGFVETDTGEQIVVATLVKDSLDDCGAGLHPAVFMEQLATDAVFREMILSDTGWEPVIFMDSFEKPLQ